MEDLQDGRILARRGITSWQGEEEILAAVGTLLEHTRGCPFCKSRNQILFTENNLFSIHCDLCNAMGPEDADLAKAIRSWGLEG